jgi:hypothetical protein
MEASDAFARFARAGLERLGIEPTEEELAVIHVADSVYGPHIGALIEADLSGVEPESEMDLSRPPTQA